MRLSVFFDHAKVAAQKRGDNIRDILRRFRAAGIETAELALRDVTDDTLALLRNAGLRVGAVYRSFDFTGAFDPSDGGFLRAPLVAGATHLLALPCLLRPENRPDAFARTIEGLRAVASLCRDAGLVPMIENFGDTRSPTCRPGDIARILDAIPDLAFNFDSGNFAVLGESPLVLCPRFAGRVAYIHAKDRTARPGIIGEVVVAPDGTTLRSCPVGAGDIPFGALFSLLAAGGIGVPVAIECFGAADMLSAVLSSARFLQGLDGKETPCLTT